jgi:adenine-specific DNA-methyltransferase
MILGDSLLVMTSFAEKEALKGQVQCIYIDPPYGIRFNSNWQPSTKTRDVKDGQADSLTRVQSRRHRRMFIDTDYDGESFFVRHAYFLGGNDPYKRLKTTLKAEIDEEAWATLYSAVSRPFEKPETRRIAVKVINHYGDEVLKVYWVV